VSRTSSWAKRALIASTLALSVAVALGAGASALSSKITGTKHHRPFTIRGDLRGSLAPGTSRPLNLRLTNRYKFALSVTRLKVRVSIDARHRRGGCSVRRDFAVVGLPTRALTLPRRATRTLRTLRVRLPRVRMRNLAHRNQDACKGARLRLRYSAVARKARATRRAR
jgi:hypothetical protein